MKAALTSMIAALALAGCGSTLTNGDKISDFKASADANAQMYDSQADVMWNAQEAVKACYKKATTDVQIMACAMHGQSANYSQAMAGRPAPNRNPQTAPEVAGDTGKAAVKAVANTAGVVGVANAVADGLSNTVAANASVQAKDPVVVTQPQPLVVRPEVVRQDVVVVP
jgi:hypothetical protein